MENIEDTPFTNDYLRARNVIQAFQKLMNQNHKS